MAEISVEDGDGETSASLEVAGSGGADPAAASVELGGNGPTGITGPGGMGFSVEPAGSGWEINLGPLGSISGSPSGDMDAEISSSPGGGGDAHHQGILAFLSFAGGAGDRAIDAGPSGQEAQGRVPPAAIEAELAADSGEATWGIDAS